MITFVLIINIFIYFSGLGIMHSAMLEVSLSSHGSRETCEGITSSYLDAFSPLKLH